MKIGLIIAASIGVRRPLRMHSNGPPIPKGLRLADSLPGTGDLRSTWRPTRGPSRQSTSCRDACGERSGNQRDWLKITCVSGRSIKSYRRFSGSLANPIF